MPSGLRDLYIYLNVRKFSVLQISLVSLVAFGNSACDEKQNSTKTEKQVSGEVKGGPDASRSLNVWFIKPANDEVNLVSVERSAEKQDRVADAVEKLLKGPTSAESASGLSTEIPKDTVLIGIKTSGQDTDLNLSKQFAASGGGTSLETRIEQLRRTVSGAAGGQKVYLDIEGERLSATAGDGLEIKQPLN